ncbi:tRNA (adenosine(37)-N6)-threonylcarbamoyltransferase complex dimerization subunit type 1 TsaB [Apilactobacillus sp. M161]|uniref:tRNA (Adenosine(37)-N6)-threonylcarbamoyltransferase complex dimerization subunit type 1 TsaB n=1 Tax=Apilactobacillus xinyiensis TaxID=2841032 RepID=A0ABT0I2S9_9LACO|nr:tRNA (adenosine(37)-N6)-threonylcarbamoyltransferase complex dimerization subunit type 1 TsaB [Apilactobacillus xinyiensis]MCK8625040.1 tRNA (adenosine(37)-N6)-threonylcarbamoyltransferase complex dimerization subunit type 1 TsaB [Apilactobacillus xinyiensis]
MKVLALDTSNRPLTVAIVEDNQILATETTTVHQKHAEFLMPIIENLFNKCDLKPNDIDRIVVSGGPGSYTGIRIATATAKTLAFTLNKELVGISSLLALALNCETENMLVMPIFNARNNNAFTGLYKIKNGQPIVILEDCHTDFDKWIEKVKADFSGEKICLVGDYSVFLDKIKAELSNNYHTLSFDNNLPKAAKIAKYGQNLNPIKDIDTFVPRYLRLTKAESDWQKLHPEEVNQSYVQKND